MKRLKSFLKKIFFLPPMPTVLIAIPSFIFVFVVLATGVHSIFTYFSYLLSAYALIITVTGMQGIVEAIRNRTCELSLVQKIRSTPFGSRLLGDAVFRSEITLHGGLFINLLYVALNLFSGIRYRSAWFISIAFYYISLSIMRTVLVHYIHHNTVGQDIPAEYRRYRICGIILLMMDQALVGIVIYMITQNQGFSYPGLMIYAMAMYSFYITIVAIINVVRYRKRGTPLLSAAKVTSLTAALVSMLSLETAMLSQFGNGEQELRRIMLAISGGIVCILILTMSVYMIVRSTKQLKKLQNNNLET